MAVVLPRPTNALQYLFQYAFTFVTNSERSNASLGSCLVAIHAHRVLFEQSSRCVVELVYGTPFTLLFTKAM